MTNPSPTTLLALDWGTTSVRAYRLGAGGSVLDQREAPLGLQRVGATGFPEALRQVIGDWAELPVTRIACGMVGSRQGWIEAPYQACPVRLEGLGSGLVRTPGGELAIVGGITCRDEAQVPDVMRGEETQIAGLPDDALAEALVVHPGTHSKWARVEAGSIASFTTYMTGEMFSVLRSASLLGRMMAPAEGFDAAAFERGAARGLSDGSVGDFVHRIFAARTLALFDELAPTAIADYLSGLLIGAEVAAGRAAAQRRSARPPDVWLLGAADLCRRYALVFERAGVAFHVGPDDAVARGLWRIAQHAGLVGAAKEPHGTGP